jgi:ribonuclease P protein component
MTTLVCTDPMIRMSAVVVVNSYFSGIFCMKHLTTIRLNKEFKRAYYQGKFKAHPLLVTYLVKNKRSENRVGITTSKKIGKAYQRNRARRIIRAAYRAVFEEFAFPCGYDIVFVARTETPKVKSTDLEKVMRKHFSVLLSQQSKEKKRLSEKNGGKES